MKKHIGVRHSAEDQTPPKQDKPNSFFILNPTLRQAAIAGGTRREPIASTSWQKLPIR